MVNGNELEAAVRRWLRDEPGAQEAADWLLNRSAVDGQIPKQPSFPMQDRLYEALASLFSAQYLRIAKNSRKCTLLFDQWEREQLGGAVRFLPVLAQACDREIRNRRLENQQRERRIAALLDQSATKRGLSGVWARMELEDVRSHRGRFWSRSQRSSSETTEEELKRYLALLEYVEDLRQEPAQIERIVHASRRVAGDTHWLRPGNAIWRDLADDLLQFDSQLGLSDKELSLKERRVRALSQVGLVENLTSVVVLVYGHFGLQRGEAVWRWPQESAGQRLPIWLSAIHLSGSRIIPSVSIERVITIENETSFLDLTQQHANDWGIALIYTEGQANRAVVALLRLLAAASPDAAFQHQGDLDLAGVRILASLRERSGVPIRPLNMDAETHRRFEKFGIELSGDEQAEIDRELAEGRLPCLDLLERIATTKVRIEQESITDSSGCSLS